MLLSGKLKIAADEDEHAAVGAGRLAIDGGNGVLALLEGEASELGDDILRALDLLTFKRQHGIVLVEIRKTGSIGVEGGVVMFNECLRHRVGIHYRNLRIRRRERDYRDSLSSALLENNAEFYREKMETTALAEGSRNFEG